MLSALVPVRDTGFVNSKMRIVQIEQECNAGFGNRRGIGLLILTIAFLSDHFKSINRRVCVRRPEVRR
jgi:hypothetical protein